MWREKWKLCDPSTGTFYFGLDKNNCLVLVPKPTLAQVRQFADSIHFWELQQEIKCQSAVNPLSNSPLIANLTSFIWSRSGDPIRKAITKLGMPFRQVSWPRPLNFAPVLPGYLKIFSGQTNPPNFLGRWNQNQTIIFVQPH